MAKGSLLHWGPLTALTIIFTLFTASVYSSLVWWPPVNFSGVINLCLLAFFLTCILYNFIKAAWVGPGYVPPKWKPDNAEHEKLMQFCQICEGYKAPRSHHCRQCNRFVCSYTCDKLRTTRTKLWTIFCSCFTRCVMKMDHHCPWINHCVGHKNHKRFTLFLFFVVIGCSYAAVTLIGCTVHIFSIVNPIVYRRIMEHQLVPFGFYHLLGIVFCIGLDIGVTVAVGILLYYQARDIVRNESSIEAWIVEKATYRRKKNVFIYPYNLGRWENIKQVIHFRGDFIGDGITWPVVDSCDQFTLTVEQLRQKQIKKNYAAEYKAVEDYNGNFFGLFHGCRTCLSFPWSLEKRLRFKKDQDLLVTRWRKYWLYGMKVHNEESVKDPEKGWFPRNCAVCVDEDGGLESSQEKPKNE
ncbi:palmitoyltransferase ZDHHC6-like isoform X2 [Dendronephthya gigantea]|uniref:palmitoyltransferase ZDHHC6-like isoform X2 n=1 Tax=Dendronephthya gigantea TaxID=151771 RepID=UPI00106D5B93|nr:palmitoyltransferase ZDHHC6-like isoform X2 [Dendronephthya gigantea]